MVGRDHPWTDKTGVMCQHVFVEEHQITLLHRKQKDRINRHLRCLVLQQQHLLLLDFLINATAVHVQPDTVMMTGYLYFVSSLQYACRANIGTIYPIS